MWEPIITDEEASSIFEESPRLELLRPGWETLAVVFLILLLTKALTFSPVHFPQQNNQLLSKRYNSILIFS